MHAHYGRSPVVMHVLRPAKTAGCGALAFGAEEVIRRLRVNPAVRAHVLSMQHRTRRDRSTFWGSSLFWQLNKDCAGAFTDASLDAALFSIGGDGVNTRNWGTRKATVIALKLEDLPKDLVQMGLAASPLFIIEGPQKPARTCTRALCRCLRSTRHRRTTKVCMPPASIDCSLSSFVCCCSSLRHCVCSAHAVHVHCGAPRACMAASRRSRARACAPQHVCRDNSSL